MLKVLIVGAGAREQLENALVWKLAQSPQISRLYCAILYPATPEST